MQGAEQKRQWGEKVRTMTDEELAAARQALVGVIESCRANPAQRKEYVELSEVLPASRRGARFPGYQTVTGRETALRDLQQLPPRDPYQKDEPSGCS